MKLKNFTLKALTALTLMLIAYFANAQQTIVIGTTDYTNSHDYAVDTMENGSPQPNGTTGSTYAWSIVEGVGTFPPGGQNTNTTDNKATINWNGVAAGTYTVRVLETNATCSTLPVNFSVTIQNPAIPVLVWADAPTAICVGQIATFDISGALPNSTIAYTATGGTPLSGNATIDAAGDGQIIITHNGTAAQIVVTLVSMTSGGSTITFPTPITESAPVNIVQTSPIVLLP